MEWLNTAAGLLAFVGLVAASTKSDLINMLIYFGIIVCAFIVHYK